MVLTALSTWLSLGRHDWPRAFTFTLSGGPEGGTEMKVFLAVCAVGVVLALVSLARDQADRPPGTPNIGLGGLALVWASLVAGAVLGAGTQAPLSFTGFLFGAVGGFLVGIPLFFSLDSFLLGVTILCGVPGLLLWGLLADKLPIVQHFGLTGLALCMGVCGVIGGGVAQSIGEKLGDLEPYQVIVSRLLVAVSGGWLLGLIGSLSKTV